MSKPSRLIDAHHHLWNPSTNNPDIGYVWLKKIGAPKPFGDPTPIQRDYLLDELLKETDIEIAGSVHVQADGAISDPVAETAFIQEISDQSGFPISIVGFVDLAARDAREIITRHKRYSNCVGMRQILSRLDHEPSLSFASQHFLQNEIWKENFNLLQEFDLSFDLQLYPEQMLEAAEFLAKHPKTQIIIDHAGSPYDPSMAGLEKWKEGMAHLSTLPNVSAKISGLGMFDLHANAKREAGVYINWILEKFGRSRTLYGSNFPVDKLMSTYDDTIETIVKHLPAGGAGEALSHSIFFENAKRIYKL